MFQFLTKLITAGEIPIPECQVIHTSLGPPIKYDFCGDDPFKCVFPKSDDAQCTDSPETDASISTYVSGSMFIANSAEGSQQEMEGTIKVCGNLDTDGTGTAVNIGIAGGGGCVGGGVKEYHYVGGDITNYHHNLLCAYSPNAGMQRIKYKNGQKPIPGSCNTIEVRDEDINDCTNIKNTVKDQADRLFDLKDKNLPEGVVKGHYNIQKGKFMLPETEEEWDTVLYYVNNKDMKGANFDDGFKKYADHFESHQKSIIINLTMDAENLDEIEDDIFKNHSHNKSFDLDAEIPDLIAKQVVVANKQFNWNFGLYKNNDGPFQEKHHQNYSHRVLWNVKTDFAYLWSTKNLPMFGSWMFTPNEKHQSKVWISDSAMLGRLIVYGDLYWGGKSTVFSAGLEKHHWPLNVKLPLCETPSTTTTEAPATSTPATTTSTTTTTATTSTSATTASTSTPATTSTTTTTATTSTSTTTATTSTTTTTTTTSTTTTTTSARNRKTGPIIAAAATTAALGFTAFTYQFFNTDVDVDMPEKEEFDIERDFDEVDREVYQEIGDENFL